MKIHTLIILITCSVVLGCATSHPDRTPPHRVIAIGDLHADVSAARAAFQLAGAIDENDDWIGENLVVVQTGDIIGRSYEDRVVLDFILSMRRKARAGGGQVHALIGNHELFGTLLQLRNVPDQAYAAFDGIPDLALRDPRLGDLPQNQRARGAALIPGGHYAKQLADFPTVLMLGETVYVHGGITPKWAAYGIDRINEELSQWFAGDSGLPTPLRPDAGSNLDDSVLFSRHFSLDVGDDDCAMLQESLRILGAKRMVVAHTVQDEITSRCDEKVWAIDVGMSRFYGGPIQVLEILDDKTLTVISEIGRR